MKLDMVVAGAGPVGLAMAAELARYGLSVKIVDKAAQRTDKSKALVVWSRTLELMDRSGCGEKLIAAGRRANGANIFAEGKEIVHIPLDGVESPHPYALMLPQSETERLLEEHLNGFGVRVERGVELIGFAPGDSGMTSKLRHPDGREETVESAWLVGCDGAHSTVRHGLGMQFEGDTLQTEWILADVRLTGVPKPGEVIVIWHAEGVLAIFPITETRYRVIADMGEIQGEEHLADPTLEEVQAILDRRGEGMTASEPVWLSRFHINERKVSDYRKGRVFLAGDAAHIHSPAGGQGMNTGIQDACNLAWKLALAHHGICKEEPLLESYSAERSAVGDQVLKGAGQATALAIMRGGVKQAIRNHLAALVFGFAPVKEMAAEFVTELSIGYPKSPMTGKGGGKRAPIREGEPPVGAGDTPRFVVFGEADGEGREVLAKYSGFVEPHIRKPLAKNELWLVRPDGYVALAVRRGDWAALSEYLGSLQ
jgi:2-polyprenyl-6-methoxyphenol hydroxylase-like FAD-dependent oxidoreductase